MILRNNKVSTKFEAPHGQIETSSTMTIVAKITITNPSDEDLTGIAACRLYVPNGGFSFGGEPKSNPNERNCAYTVTCSDSTITLEKLSTTEYYVPVAAGKSITVTFTRTSTLHAVEDVLLDEHGMKSLCKEGLCNQTDEYTQTLNEIINKVSAYKDLEAQCLVIQTKIKKELKLAENLTLESDKQRTSEIVRGLADEENTLFEEMDSICKSCLELRQQMEGVKIELVIKNPVTENITSLPCINPGTGFTFGKVRELPTTNSLFAPNRNNNAFGPHSGFSFGGRTTTSFGGNNSGGFGSSSTSSGSSLFGCSVSPSFSGASSTNNERESGSGFGSSGSLFGSTSEGSSLFGGGTSAYRTPSGGSAFGSTPGSGNVAPLGSTSASPFSGQENGSSTHGHVFGQTSEIVPPTQPVSHTFGGSHSSPFGSAQAKPEVKQESPVESKPPTPTFGRFGSSAPQPSSKPTSGFSFGSSQSTAKEEAKPTSGFSFGGSTSSPQSKPASGGFSFGSSQSKEKEEAKPTSSGFSFGASPSQSKPASGGFSFGSSQSTEKEAKPKSPSAFSFGAPPGS